MHEIVSHRGTETRRVFLTGFIGLSGGGEEAEKQSRSEGLSRLTEWAAIGLVGIEQPFCSFSPEKVFMKKHFPKKTPRPCRYFSGWPKAVLRGDGPAGATAIRSAIHREAGGER